MTELLKVDDAGHDDVVLMRKIDSVPSEYNHTEFNASGINIFAPPKTNTAGNDRARIIQFYDRKWHREMLDLKHRMNEEENLQGAVGGGGGTAIFFMYFPTLGGAFGYGVFWNIINILLGLGIIFIIVHSIVRNVRIKSLKMRYEDLAAQRVNKNFKATGDMSNYLHNFLNTNCAKGRNMLLLDTLRSKFEAEQSDEELIAWMKTVELILSKDAKFPVDLIPVESEEAADVLARIPDKCIERSPEHEILALEDARAVADQLKHDSVALHTGALRYLGVDE